MSGDLKPCPFCGQYPVEEWHNYAGGTLEVSCSNSKCPMMSVNSGLAEASVSRGAWNTRPIEKAWRATLDAAILAGENLRVAIVQWGVRNAGQTPPTAISDAISAYDFAISEIIVRKKEEK